MDVQVAINLKEDVAVSIDIAPPNIIVPVPAQGYYALENDMLDTSGNNRHASAVGSGPTFDTTNPLPPRDIYFAKLAEDDAISVPTSVFIPSMATVGTLEAAFFVHPDIATTTAMVLYGDFGANGELFTSFNGNKVFVNVPTTIGSQLFSTPTAVLKFGKWYKLFITYTSTTLKVYLRDLCADSEVLIIDETLVASTMAFSGATQLLIGNFGPDLGTWNYSAGIDHAGYFDTVITDDGRQTTPQFCVMHVGHSTVFGTIPALGCRDKAHEFFISNSMYYNFNGDKFNGTGIMKMNSGVNGDTTAGIDARIDAALDEIFPQTSGRQIIWLGPMMANDCGLAVPLATTKANIESIINKIDTHGSNIKIMLITDNDKTTPPTNIEDYNDVLRTVYSEQLALGKNVFLMDLFTQGIPLADGVHPTPAGYDQMGEYLASTTQSLLA